MLLCDDDPVSDLDAEPALVDEPTHRRAGRRWSVVLVAVLGFGLVAGLTFALLAALHRQRAGSLPASSSTTQLRASGIPASVPTSLAYLMALSPVPNQLAPAFTLVDQHGRTVSLAGLRGRPVVLEFMDPHCVDVCPIVSQEFIDAYHDLGPLASTVVFVAVNVNAYHSSVADMAAYSREHHLNALPTWYFLTGPVASLEAVWHGYHVAVSAPSPDADIVHTSVMYFIDPQGRERYLAIPMIDHAANGTAYLPAGPLASWGMGIALVASSFS